MIPLGKWAARRHRQFLLSRLRAIMFNSSLPEVGYFPFAYLNSRFKNILLVCGAIEAVYYFHKEDVMERHTAG